MILKIFSLLLMARVTSAKCPSSCQCYEQSTVRSMFCVQASLTGIPNSFDLAVKIFNFTGNRVAVLRDDAFRNPYYADLEMVDLKNNGIQTIAPKALHKLQNLLELDLSDNNIRSIDGKMFEKNRFLNTLRLSGNPIEQLKRYTFPPLTYLRKLDLHACKLKKIHRSAFANTPRLENLNLNANALKYAPFKPLRRLTRLVVVQLDDNPLRCDENLWHLLKWLRYRNATSQSYALCVYGETENAVFWDTMDANEASAKFKIMRDKRAVGGERTESVRKRTVVATAFKTQQHQREYAPKRDIFTTPKYRVLVDDYDDDDNDNCTQTNEYSPGKDFNTKGNVTGTEKTFVFPNAISATSVGTVKKDQNVAPAKKPAQTATRVRYNNAKVAKNYVDQARNYSRFRKLDSSNMPRSVFGDVSQSNDTVSAAADEIRPQYQHSYEQQGDDDHDDRVGSFFEENHTVVLVVEVTLIVILLVVLYKLWNEGRKRSEQGADVPLNNGNNNVKTYHTQTSNYKRYSLSDEDYPYPDIRNDRDEAKYDAESGYLSYHRYNSIEGENNNDFAYYRRYYGGNEDDRDSEQITNEFINHTYPSTNQHEHEHEHEHEQSVDVNFTTNTIPRPNSGSSRSRNGQHSLRRDHSAKSKPDTSKNHPSDDDNNNQQ